MQQCAICHCPLTKEQGTYATTTLNGRSHRSRHHFVAERFFGRSANRRGTLKERIFDRCPWGQERQAEFFCYECHELLLHNPVLLPEDIATFSKLVEARGLIEKAKPQHYRLIAGRIQLLREVIAAGLVALASSQVD